MSIESRLAKKSVEYASNLAKKLPVLRGELEAALANVSELNRMIEIAESAPERAQSFESRIDSRLQCPRCWIEDHAHADLDSISADELPYVFRCVSCGRSEKFYARV